MTTDATRFPAFIAEVAALRGVTDPQRIAAWQERLAWSFDDLSALEAALPVADPLIAPPFPGSSYSPPRGMSTEHRPGIVAQAIEVRSGRHRALDLAMAALAAADAWRHANAFIDLQTEDVLRQAESIDAQVRRRANPGPLAGIPVAVKDLIPVRGYRMTGGTRARDTQVAEKDAAVVARLRAAGAVIFGTTNLHELAFGVTSANPHFGAVVNPRHPGRIPGGSSGGSAAAVAAGIVSVALGSDTGGSIRIPAACCGIVGFKPTFGMIEKSDVLPLAWSLDHLGPIAACVDDAATVYEVLAGLPDGATGGVPERPPAFVFIGGRFTQEGVEGSVLARMKALDREWRAAGARVASTAVDALRLAGPAQFVTIGSEATAANADILSVDATRLGQDVRLRLELGQLFLASDYVKAQRIRSEVRAALLAALGDADVLVLPSMPCAPPGTGQSVVSINGHALPIAGMLTRFTSPFNMTGLPALSLPCGFDAEGLPLSVQLVGRPGEDARVLATARWVERQLAGAGADGPDHG